MTVPFITRRIRLTRSILLDGKHAEKGSVHEVATELAHDLIAQDSAVPLRTWRWAVAACVGLGMGALLWWGMARGWW